MLTCRMDRDVPEINKSAGVGRHRIHVPRRATTKQLQGRNFRSSAVVSLSRRRGAQQQEESWPIAAAEGIL
jgi:hypothetical protein